MDAQLALGRGWRDARAAAGEEAKTLAALDRLWQELRLDRSGTIVALGGGCTTDAAGFAAATYLRGIAWTPVPTSLVAQVDAAIGGKTAIDLPQGKNLVGAFHWPVQTVVDPALLETSARAAAASKEWRGREGRPPRRTSRSGSCRKTSWSAGRLPSRPAICLRDPARARRADRCSTSATRSRTHSRLRPATRESRTGAPVALGLCSQPCALRAVTRRSVEEVLPAAAGPGSTQAGPGRR
jgi:hypothetical protein